MTPEGAAETPISIPEPVGSQGIDVKGGTPIQLITKDPTATFRERMQRVIPGRSETIFTLNAENQQATSFQPGEEARRKKGEPPSSIIKEASLVQPKPRKKRESARKAEQVARAPLTEAEKKARAARVGEAISITVDKELDPNDVRLVVGKGGKLIVKAGRAAVGGKRLIARIYSKGVTISIPREDGTRLKVRLGNERIQEAVDDWRARRVKAALSVAGGVATGIAGYVGTLGLGTPDIMSGLQSLRDLEPATKELSPLINRAREAVAEVVGQLPSVDNLREAARSLPRNIQELAGEIGQRAQALTERYIVQPGENLWQILEARVQSATGLAGNRLTEVVNALKNLQLSRGGELLRHLRPGQQIEMPTGNTIDVVRDCLAHQPGGSTPGNVADWCTAVRFLAHPSDGINAAVDPGIRQAAEIVTQALGLPGP